jgi:radical SAM protein (TIGR01212 family)
MNKYINSDDNKRYYTFNYYLKKTYGKKIAKISLNTNFSCPNRDGKVAFGGCSFCSALGSGDFAGNSEDDLMKQYHSIKAKMSKKWYDSDYIAYFQAYTNTYAPLKILQECFEPFTKIKEVKAIAIATRPDALEDDVIQYLDSLTRKKDIWIELGLQTTYDESARAFNRGYDYQLFLETIDKLKNTNLKICVHMINGFPLETKEMMLENIKRISKLDGIDAIKIHMLHLIKNTKMANEYLEKPWQLLSMDEYIQLVVEQLSYLKPDMIVQRLTGDAKSEDLIAPLWTLKKIDVLNGIDKYMAKYDITQGDNYE